MFTWAGSKASQPQAGPAIASRLRRIPASSACVLPAVATRYREEKRSDSGGVFFLLLTSGGWFSSRPPFCLQLPLSLPPFPTSNLWPVWTSESPRRIIRSAHGEGQRCGRPGEIRGRGALRTMEALLCNNKPHQTPPPSSLPWGLSQACTRRPPPHPPTTTQVNPLQLPDPQQSRAIWKP